MKIHFYKIHSRLGMLHPPIHSMTHNTGVEHGADSVISSLFLKEFPKETKVTSYTFPTPESTNNSNYETVLAHHSEKLLKLIQSTLGEDEFQIIVGGDHSVAFPSLLAVLLRYSQKKIGYIQLDSHGDLHTFASSPSGNFHGMWLRYLMEQIPNSSLSRIVTRLLPTNALLYVGNLELESEETDFIAKNTISWITKKQIEESLPESIKSIQAFISRFDHIHIGFDIDIFDQTIAPATGTPNPHGLSRKVVFPILKLLSQHPSRSIDIVEVNPMKSGATQTIQLAQEVLITLLGT